MFSSYFTENGRWKRSLLFNVFILKSCPVHFTRASYCYEAPLKEFISQISKSCRLLSSTWSFKRESAYINITCMCVVLTRYKVHVIKHFISGLICAWLWIIRERIFCLCSVLRGIQCQIFRLIDGKVNESYAWMDINTFLKLHIFPSPRIFCCLYTEFAFLNYLRPLTKRGFASLINYHPDHKNTSEGLNG